MKRKAKILFLILGFLTYPIEVFSWDDDTTHETMSIKAAEHSILNGDYLKDIGLLNGLEETFSSTYIEVTTNYNATLAIKDWIGKGAIEEDSGDILTAYYYNHFHNPLASSWDQAGLSTWYPGINGESSILWAQDASNPWSWQKVREYFRLALTSETLNERNEYFAKTFKGVGHLIHLIQDAAQPAHVRNDPHPLDTIGVIPQFEYWAVDNGISYMSNPIFPSDSLNTLTQFWDTDQYTENSTTLPSGNSFGIAEYTNANFFSEDTINAGNFPYPNITETTITERTAPSGNYQRQYYLKNCCGETNDDQGYLLAAVDFLDYYRQQYPLFSFALPKIPVLDNNVYSDYASLLIPRAVGYSAGLLNYFFRGQIDMVPDPNNPAQYVIKNDSTEAMSGTFTLYYDKDNTDLERVEVGNLTVSEILPGKTSTVPLIFIAPTDAKEKGKYILVFQGKLGNEEGAVVGKIVESGVWEDWEKGLTGKHPWSVKFGSDSNFTVTSVTGPDRNPSNALKIYVAPPYNNAWKKIGTLLEEATTIPQTVSFDYYVKSAPTGNLDFNFGLYFLDGYNGCGIDIVDPSAVYTACGVSKCYYMETGRWTHVEFSNNNWCWISHFDSVVINIYRNVMDPWALSDIPIEIYIDNIDFK
jgi:hypothetical protein